MHYAVLINFALRIKNIDETRLFMNLIMLRTYKKEKSHKRDPSLNNRIQFQAGV